MRDTYQPAKAPTSQDVAICGLRYRVYTWGDAGLEPVYLLHGWADVGLSFQFLIDALADNYYFIAPDWRGFGASQWAGAYWFPQYLADLDALIAHFSSDLKVRLVGHSMGGNIAWLYAGIRAARVSHVVNIDAVGLPDSCPQQAPERYNTWLDQLNQHADFRQFQSIDELADYISHLAPTISTDKAMFVAQQWADADAHHAGLVMKADPAHKIINPVLYRREEARSCWRRITANAMLVLAGESKIYKQYRGADLEKELHGCIDNLKIEVVEGAGHMLHLEKPKALADIIMDFFATA